MGLLVNRKLSSAAALALILIAGLSCSDNSVTGPDGLTTDSLSADDSRVIANVEVTLASNTVAVGETTQATAVFLDKYGRRLKRTVDWSSSNPAVATVDTSGLVKALAVGSTSIIATHRLHSGSASLSVISSALPPPPEPSGTNEPSGTTLIADRKFNAIDELGWSDEGSRGTIIQDATAPKSPSGVLRTTLPAGFSAGGGTYSGDLTFTARRTLYISYWARLSSNWQGQEAGVNKQFYAYTNGSTPSVYFDAHGTGSGPLVPQIAGQDIVAGGIGGDPNNPDWSPNIVPSARLIRGQWYHIEVLLVGNSSGTADGSIDWYLDGVHIGSYSKIQFQTRAVTWNWLHYTNLWGGAGGTVQSTMYLDWDDLYVSGKN